MINPVTNEPFTEADVDRILGLADQFLEDWEQNEGEHDPEGIERRKEWDALRPLLVQAPVLLMLLSDARQAVLQFADTDLHGILTGDICAKAIEAADQWTVQQIEERMRKNAPPLVLNKIERAA